VYKVTSEKTTEIQYLNNNHIESDTRLFFLLTNVDLGKPVWVIRSTDTDMLFIALINHPHLNLDSKTIYINYNKNGEAPKYCSVNHLVKCLDDDTHFSLLSTKDLSAARFIGLLHLLTTQGVTIFLSYAALQRICVSKLLRDILIRYALEIRKQQISC